MIARATRNPFLRLLMGLVLTLPLGLACSKKVSADDAYKKALVAIESSIQPATTKWATGIARAASRDLEEKGATDPSHLQTIATETAAPVGDAACQAIKDHKELYNTDQHSLDGRRQLSDFIDREMVAALGRAPLVLYDFKVAWPPTWLVNPPTQAQYGAPTREADPQYLRTVLLPAFVGSDGSFLAPTLSSPGGDELIDWLRSSGLPFPSRVVTLTGPVTSAIFDCVSREVRPK